jgi:competence protein ComEC
MVNVTGDAPSTGFAALQTALGAKLSLIEAFLDHERTQLPLWLPVFFGLGIAMWFVIPTHIGWLAFIGLGVAIAGLGVSVGVGTRLGRAMLLVGVMTSSGCASIWLRSSILTESTLTRPVVAEFHARIVSVEAKATLGQMRLILTPDPASKLPHRVRVSIKTEDAVAGLVPDAQVHLKARLMPPAAAAVPGGYDFARAAWFQQLGATGKVLGQISIQTRVGNPLAETRRQQLSSYIAARIGDDGAGIAAALASGDQGRVSAQDQDAMRASGLAHLLSVSGLHISAVVGAVMFLTLRLLALSPALALRFSLPIVAAGAGALAGIGYTLLSGAEVPTVRSCIAALLVLGGLALGREAMTLRLVATGALIVLFLWPESLVGPSFQLSFAAITAIVALHEIPWVQSVLKRREEKLLRRLCRILFSLLLTGIVVEIALAPIALFHFHKSGIYGALANIVAIPLTTFVIMPFEALALLFDAGGIGGPFWWVAARAIAFLLWIAHGVASAPGAVAMVPSIPGVAYAMMVSGGLWLILWRSKIRALGIVPLSVGCAWAGLLAPPDLLVTGDGRHVAIRGNDGAMAILRPRAGDYVRNTLADRAGIDMLDEIDFMDEAQCSADSCVVDIIRSGRPWRILATRSKEMLPWRDFVAACAVADIVISDRALPKACLPRWFRADRYTLFSTGGLAITLSDAADTGAVTQVQRPGDEHPWARRPDVRPKRSISTQ